MARQFNRDLQYYKFCTYGFLKNLNFFEPFFVLFFLEKGMTFLEIGTLYSIGQIATNILEIPTGVAADALGRRRTMIYSFISYIISFLIFYFATSYTLCAVAMIFWAFGEAFRTGTHKAMIFEYLKIKGWLDQKVHYYGRTRASSQMGSALSALIAAAIVFYSGSYRLIFLYSTIPYFLDLLLMITYPKELDGHLEAFKTEKVKETILRVIKDFIISFKDKLMLKAIANLSFYTGYYNAAKDFLQPILESFALGLPIFITLQGKQRSALVIGFVYFILYFLTSLASRHAGNFADKYKGLCLLLNTTMMIGYMAGLISGLLIILGVPFLAILAYMFIYLIENLRKPMGISYVSDMMKHDILATALSAESQTSTLIAAILAPIIGFFADKWGVGYAIAFVSLLMILPAPLYFAKKKSRA